MTVSLAGFAIALSLLGREPAVARLHQPQRQECERQRGRDLQLDDEAALVGQLRRVQFAARVDLEGGGGRRPGEGPALKHLAEHPLEAATNLAAEGLVVRLEDV